MTQSKPLIWVLLGPNKGDNNQALALAEELRLPFEIKELGYARIGGRDLGMVKPKRLGASLLSLDSSARKQIKPPWPDLVIGVGRRSVPVALHMREKSGGRAKLVRIGNPRLHPSQFDLVITTRQYPVPPGDNVLLLPLAMSRFATPPEPTAEEREFLASMGQFQLLAIGGPAKYWRLPEDIVLQHISEAASGSCPVVVATSRRTPPGLVEAIKQLATGAPNMAVVDGPVPRFAVLLNAANQIVVTGDSVSMMSEAVLTGRPVAIIPIQRDEEGLEKLGPVPQQLTAAVRRRDLRRFWDYLIEQGLVGTVGDQLRAPAEIPNPNAIAAQRVRALLGDAS